MAWAAVMGHTVVYRATVSVTTTTLVDSGWPAGQLVTVGAQLVMVFSTVVKTVEVVRFWAETAPTRAAATMKNCILMVGLVIRR